MKSTVNFFSEEGLKTPNDLTRFFIERYKQWQCDDTSRIVIMAGHAMPFYDGNKVYLSLHSQVPKNILEQMKKEKMYTFSEYSFERACQVVAELQSLGFNSKLAILINNITHMLEALDHPSNIKNPMDTGVSGSTAHRHKSMQDLQEELLHPFYSDAKLPQPYLNALNTYDLSLNDIIPNYVSREYQTERGKTKKRTEEVYFFAEKLLQNYLQDFITGSPELKEFFGVFREVHFEKAFEEIVRRYPELRTMEKKVFCAQKNVPGQPGGIDCSKEMISFSAAIQGLNQHTSDKVPPIFTRAQTFKRNALVSFIPMGCNDAVRNGNLMYQYLMSPPDCEIDLFEIPFASNAENSDFTILRGLSDVH